MIFRYKTLPCYSTTCVWCPSQCYIQKASVCAGPGEFAKSQQVTLSSYLFLSNHWQLWELRRDVVWVTSWIRFFNLKTQFGYRSVKALCSGMLAVILQVHRRDDRESTRTSRSTSSRRASLPSSVQSGACSSFIEVLEGFLHTCTLFILSLGYWAKHLWERGRESCLVNTRRWRQQKEQNFRLTKSSKPLCILPLFYLQENWTQKS